MRSKRRSSARNGELSRTPLFRAPAVATLCAQPAAAGRYHEKSRHVPHPPVDPTTAEGKLRDLFAGIQKGLGAVLNLYRVIARSPVALEGALALAGALARGRIRPRLREQIAIAVAQENACDYCLSAHTALGRGLRVSDADLTLAREGRASDPQDDAALRFVRRVVELVANTVLNVFTNYLNQVAETEIDFPVVRASTARAA